MLQSKTTDFSKFAIHKVRPKMIRFLIQSGADVNTLEPPFTKKFMWHAGYLPT